MTRALKDKRRAIVRRVMLACVAVVFAGLAFGQSAWGLDPALDVSQYAHTAWKVREGFAQGAITSIAQTPDGYLWLGTEFGLLRFDGVRAVPWQPPAGEQLPSSYIRNLLVARDGTLWIATGKGLASWKDGKLTNYPEVAGRMLLPLLQDREGTVWLGLGSPGELCAIQAGKVECYGAGSFGQGVGALYEDRKGNLWVSGQTGLWRWKPGPPEHYAMPLDFSADALMEDESGTPLLATLQGLKRLAGGKIQDYVLPGVRGEFRPSRFLRSSDGSLWVGTVQGLLHIHQGRANTFGPADGLSGDSVFSIFEDREGSVWIGTTNGLDQFREYAFPRISRNQGLSTSNAYSVQATADGTIWIGTTDGLNRWQNGHVTVYGKRSGPEQSGRRNEWDLSIHGTVMETANGELASNARSLGLDDQGRLWVSTGDGVFTFEDGRFVRVPGIAGGNIYGMAADGHGKMWISHDSLGLFYLAPGDAVQTIPWSVLGHKGFGAGALLPDRSQGGVWLGFYEGGVVYVKEGQVRASYTAADGLGSGRVNQLRFGSLGWLWAATEGGLSRIKDGHVATLTSKNGLPCDQVHWSIEDDDHFVWVYMPCGLVRIARSELNAWVSDPGRKPSLTMFDTSDGVRRVGAYGGYGPHVIKSGDGRIWFVHRDGVSVIDPRHLPSNKLPPPVYIEQVIADHKTYWQNWSGDAYTSKPKLPPLARDLEIDYTALSLVAPEKVRFRYKLEGWDRDWQDAGNRRQAFYNNLPPRKYRFRVAACNNSGVWNETGDTLEFSVAPAYYQTWWFRLSCVAAFIVLLWGIYRLRLRQATAQVQHRLEGRFEERERIARELHDTLLQSFQAVLLFFQAASDKFATRPAEAKLALDGAIDKAAQAVTEGRHAIQGLRSSTTETNSLAASLRILGEELAGNPSNQHSPVVDVQVEGAPRELHPIIRDDVFRIAGEALRNAFLHAQASRIEVDIRYGTERFRVRIRDDGKGMDSQVVTDKGRPGHWGLPGMHERAKLVGGNLNVWSKSDAGTEIELNIPAMTAYGLRKSRWFPWFSR